MFRRDRDSQGKPVGASALIAFGVATGCGIGIAMSNLPVGIGLGVGVVGLIVFLSRRGRGDSAS